MFFITIISFLSTIDGGYLDSAIQLLFVQKGIQTIEIGLSVSLVFLFTMFLQLFIQKAVIRDGYKRYLLISIFMFVTSLVLIVITNNKYISLICNISQGISIWLEWTLIQSYVIDVSGSASQYGKLQLITNVGNGFGAIIFLIIMLSNIQNKYTVSIGITIISYIILFAIFIFKKNVKPNINMTYNESKSIGYKNILKEKISKLYILYYIISSIQYSLFSTLIGILISVSLGMGDINLSIYNCLKYILGAIIINISIKRGVSKRVENIVLILVNIFFVIALFGNPWIIIFTLIFNRSVVYSIFSISVETKVHDIYSDGRSSLLIGMQSSAEYIGYAVGAFVSGILLSYNYRYLIATAFIFMIVVTVILYFLRKEIRDKGIKEYV